MTALSLNRPHMPLPLGLLYYPGVRCPGCGGRHFHVGRVTAECDRCDAALVLSTPSQEH